MAAGTQKTLAVSAKFGGAVRRIFFTRFPFQ